MKRLKEKILEGYGITKEEAMELWTVPLEELKSYANDIREFYCGSSFDICTIINAKSGKCSEDCKFCAQSIHYSQSILTYPLLDEDKIITDAKKQEGQGIRRYSLVTSGRKLSKSDLQSVVQIVKRLRDETSLNICVSFGLLTEEEFRQLKEAGVSRVHNNLEASKNYFSKICTTHSFEDKMKAISNAMNAGLDICSGGIIGMGETLKDRVDLAFALKDLNINSVPINVLNPIPGTPFGDLDPLPYEEILRTISIFRFILPDRFLRLAGGRALFPDKGREALRSGINAFISGDMLTTAGISTKDDLKMIEEEFSYY
ncbi:MAG: biotin synthase BioB [Tissierellia bacterium]|nr:biotin synthase BioB [Tissierellia bacterium]